tara:strand:- start:3795 stop:4109 length:315 start_codon:yes stop_codon:yes gene_type:complete
VDFKNYNMLEIIQAKVGLEKVFLRAKLALEDLEKKTPHKKKLIENQRDSLEELAYVRVILGALDDKCKLLNKEIYDLRKINLEIKAENLNLTRSNQKMIDNIEL